MFCQSPLTGSDTLMQRQGVMILGSDLASFESFEQLNLCCLLSLQRNMAARMLIAMHKLALHSSHGILRYL